MFDCYNHTNNKYSVKNEMHINAVGGTIVKNHRNSFMVSVKIGTNGWDRVFVANPTWLHHTEHNKVGTDRYGFDQYRDKDIYEPVVVLQAMLCGDERVIVELMWKNDLDKAYEEELDDAE